MGGGAQQEGSTERRRHDARRRLRLRQAWRSHVEICGSYSARPAPPRRGARVRAARLRRRGARVSQVCALRPCRLLHPCLHGLRLGAAPGAVLLR